jgi:small subunit ribosomal protein S14
MAKVSAIDKNKKRMSLVAKQKNKRKELKDIIYSKDLPIEERFNAVQKLSKLHVIVLQQE